MSYTFSPLRLSHYYYKFQQKNTNIFHHGIRAKTCNEYGIAKPYNYLFKSIIIAV